MPVAKDRLTLFTHFCSYFDKQNFDDFRQYKQVNNLPDDVVTHESGLTNVGYLLQNLVNHEWVEENFVNYDQRIQKYTEWLNRGRYNIRLKYFQYLSALYSEIYLHRFFEDKFNLHSELDRFVTQRNYEFGSHRDPLANYDPSDLQKVAFWMATGSGKTLLMHINYWQFLHYHREHSDDEIGNIILISPQAHLSDQHIHELSLSGIPASHIEDAGSGFEFEEDKVNVVEIHKLQEEEGQQTIAASELGDNEGSKNLVFVDEAHKGVVQTNGSSGYGWVQRRNDVVGDGFAFEYSATFGQVLSHDNLDVKREYEKSILFDYSFENFHEDKYGKNFRIMNLEDDDYEFSQDLLLGNLLSFYQQLRIWEENPEIQETYNVEKPLWIFVGKNVSAVYTLKKQDTSDVLRVVQFLDEVAKNANNDIVKNIEALIEGNTLVINRQGENLFKHEFRYLRSKLEAGETYSQLSSALQKRFFHASRESSLKMYRLSEPGDEIGLKTVAGSDPFGVINVGDVRAFLNLVDDEAPNLNYEEDRHHFQGSLFERIEKPDSSINCLIGSQKFSEGWSSWRVSSMGLLHMGRTKGPQVMQLFGRGVRLKGKNFTLKRSEGLPENGHPQSLQYLERLNIFGVKADYLDTFQQELKEEGVPVDDIELGPVEVEPQEEHLNEGLIVPRRDRQSEDTYDSTIELEAKTEWAPRIQLIPRASLQQSDRESGSQIDVEERFSQNFDEEIVELLDWKEITHRLRSHKNENGYHNLIFNMEDLKCVLLNNGCYALLATEGAVEANSVEDLKNIQDTAVRVLKAYVDRFYSKCKQSWEEQQLCPEELEADDPNIDFGGYDLRVPEDERGLIEQLEMVINDHDLSSEEDEQFTSDNEPGHGLNILFEKHLYLPLLIDRGEVHKKQDFKISPPGLNRGELDFVKDLENFCQNNTDPEWESRDFYLLRNQERGAGIGFFVDSYNFYPDFVLWIKEGGRQYITFIDPKGLVWASHFGDQKLHLWQHLKNEIEPELNEMCPGQELVLDAAIVSPTEYDDIPDSLKVGGEKLLRNRIVFQKNQEFYKDNYIASLLQVVVKRKEPDEPVRM